MKLGMASNLEPRLPHANHGAVHLFLGWPPTLSPADIHPLHGHDIPTNLPPRFRDAGHPIYGKPVSLYIYCKSRGPVLTVFPLFIIRLVALRLWS